MTKSNAVIIEKLQKKLLEAITIIAEDNDKEELLKRLERIKKTE